jgi:hypothetical protein
MGSLQDKMGWARHGPSDLAERETNRGLLRTVRDTAALDDRQTVQQWLRELGTDGAQQVFVHRPWGTVVAVADGHHPVRVFLTDGDRSWWAVPPPPAADRDLTPEQTELIVLDALTASERPEWPDWQHLV